MNFYNPYFYSAPTSTATSLLSKINLSSIINGTTKTLNLVNQAIPIVKQVSPIIKNAKTMFTVMNEFKKTESPTTNYNSNNQIISNDIQPKTISNSYPTFFI